VNWSDFEAAAPELAAHGRQRFEATRVALLGTVRADGSARISPVEPFLAAGQLMFGVMRSRKSGDLERDRRVTLHSSVSRPDGSEGEFKLFGAAVPISDAELRESPPDAWWHSYPPDMSAVYWVDVTSASFLTWNWDTSTYHMTSWSATDGVSRRTARYP
jgi:hypothetical protein